MSGYMGLMMGCSRPYWLGIIQKIHSLQAQQGKWSWNDVRTTFPEISNSDMRRLNCSNWFTPAGRSGQNNRGNNVKTSMWQLQPDAVMLVQREASGERKKSGGKKRR